MFEHQDYLLRDFYEGNTLRYMNNPLSFLLFRLVSVEEKLGLETLEPRCCPVDTAMYVGDVTRQELCPFYLCSWHDANAYPPPKVVDL